jgi:hypothetical protein
VRVRVRVLTVLAAALPWLLAGCEKKESDLGKDAGNLAADTQVLKDASAAANEVVGKAGDCDAVKAALPETNRKLDDATKRVRTMTGRASLDSLKRQVTTIADACP